MRHYMDWRRLAARDRLRAAALEPYRILDGVPAGYVAPLSPADCWLTRLCSRSGNWPSGGTWP
jgi:hypothetical protein